MSEFWLARGESADAEADELALVVLTAQAERVVATRELADMGITASPADASVWAKATPKQQRSLALAWVALIGTPEPEWKNPKDVRNGIV
jgi:hypothetical protein